MRVSLALQRRLTLTLDTPELGSAELPIAFGFGPSTGSLDWSGACVVTEPRCAEAELANATALQGNVALAHRGGCTFAEKATRVAAAGALALVVVNNKPEETSFQPTDPNKEYTGSMPVFGVSAQVGAAIIGAGEGVRLVLAPP